MKKKNKSASRNRLIFFGTLSIFIIAFFVVSFIAYGLKLKNLEDEKTKVNKELVLLFDKEDYLQNEINKLKDPNYLARYARENYMYSKDGEYIIKIDKEEVAKLESKKTLSINYILPSVLIICIVLSIFIIKKIFRK